MLTRRQLVARLNAVAGLAALGPTALASRAAADIISKRATLLVGFAAGGGTDVAARMLAERLRGLYAPTIIVENKVGAASRIAVEAVKNGDPDGSVLLFTPDFPVTLYPHIFKTLSYDPARDLTPVAPVLRSTLTFNIGPAVPESVRTLPDFLAWAKANPSKANFGTTSAGGTPHFVGVMVSNASGVPLSMVHYRGGAPALQDLIGGHVAATVNPSSESLLLTQANGPKVRIIAVIGAQRSRFLPDTPTIKEQGLDVTLDSWSGVFAPKGMQPEIVAALAGAIEKVVMAPDMVEAQAKLGAESWRMPQPDFAKLVAADTKRWAEVVKVSGFTPLE